MSQSNECPSKARSVSREDIVQESGLPTRSGYSHAARVGSHVRDDMAHRSVVNNDAVAYGDRKATASVLQFFCYR